MNPFDLPGPIFLLFYVMFACIALALVALRRRAMEQTGEPRLQTSEPYLIAYLRGGANEVLRLAMVKLVDLGYLKADDDKLSHRSGGPVKVFQPAVEAAVFDFFAKAGAPASVLNDGAARTAAEGYQRSLEQIGWMPDRIARERRLGLFGVAATALLGVGLLKIGVALERGRHNIQFLIILMIAFTFLSYKTANPRLMGLGDRMLLNLRTLFARNRAKASEEGFRLNNDEAILIAAIWGAANIGSPRHEWVRKAFSKSQGSSGGDSSCGSSSGDSGDSGSSGDSGGSSCGGGGGCGGCGS
jgi:uncharacterized protein (TIGR04222 family)